MPYLIKGKFNRILKFSGLFTCLCFLSVLPNFSQSQSRRSNKVKQIEIAAINKYSKTVNNLTSRTNENVEIYGDTSLSQKPKWKKFKTEKNYKKATEKREIYDSAYVWRQEGSLIAANFTFTSGSGDWVHYINYYFRSDGSLAKIDADLNTFYGHLIALRTLYFDENGKLLRKTSRFYSMETKKPIKPADEEFIDEKIYIYKKVSQLPFASLLKN